MNAAFVHKYPALRLLLPLALGVMCGDTLYDLGSKPLSGLFFIGFVILAFLLLFLYHRHLAYRLRWLFGLLNTVLMLLLGALLINLYYDSSSYVYADSPRVYRVEIARTPEWRERSVRCQVNVVEQIDSLQQTPIRRKALIYLLPDSLSHQLRCGDELLIYTDLSQALLPSHPDAFNYMTYLRRKGVSGSGYVAQQRFTVTKHNDKQTLTQRADQWRERLVNYYRRLGFGGDELAILTALTLGDKSELSDEQRDVFSVAGASHILAISGMHILFIYALLCFLLQLLSKHNRWSNIIRHLLIIGVLWAYVFLIGFPPSAVRATIMFTLLLCATLFSGERISLNLVFATAFIMLLLRPVWLFDVGFQLSFAAVISILLIQPLLYHLIKITNRVGRYVWEVITLTLAAQIGTAPLVAFYFSRFSTYFLLSGLMLVVQVSAIIYGTFVMFLFAPFPWLQQKVVFLLKELLQLLIATAHWIVSLPSASFDDIWIYRGEVVLFYFMLISIVLFAMKRNAKMLIASVTFLLLFLIGGSWCRSIDSPGDRIVFYNQKHSPAIHCITSNRNSWIVYGDTLSHTDELQKEVSRYWNKMRLNTPKAILGDCRHSSLWVNSGIVNFKGCTIAMINNNHWSDLISSAPLTLDYIYLCSDYRGTITALNRLFNFKRVIIDTSVTPYHLKQWMEECKQLNLPVVALSLQGSHTILL